MLPFDFLFWCLGSQGSAYPLTGNTNYRDTPIQAGTLITLERLGAAQLQVANYKLHRQGNRQGMVWETRGEDGVGDARRRWGGLGGLLSIYQYPTPIPDANLTQVSILPKSRYRYQIPLSNERADHGRAPITDAAWCRRMVSPLHHDDPSPRRPPFGKWATPFGKWATITPDNPTTGDYGR
ncbi:TraU family protein (plasmid) [Vibrio splendidus]